MRLVGIIETLVVKAIKQTHYTIFRSCSRMMQLIYFLVSITLCENEAATKDFVEIVSEHFQLNLLKLRDDSQ